MCSSDLIAWLDGFLQSAEVPSTAMSLEELDGFITGLVIGPDVVMPSEYMPMIWGGEDGDSPEFESLEQIQRFLGLLMRRWNTIADQTAAGPDHVPWVGSQDDPERGRAWARGFAEAMGMRAKSWRPLVENEDGQLLLAPILGLCSEDLGDDEDEQAQEPLSASDRAAAIESVPMALAGIFAYWRQRRGALATGTVRRSSRKVGRNEQIGRAHV